MVSGLPAAGKSTLSKRLSRDLSYPLVWRDGLKRDVFTELWGKLDDFTLLPRAMDKLINHTVSANLDVGIGAVVDGNFNTPEPATALRSLLEERSATAIEVCLWGDVGVLRDRFIARADPPLDPDLLPYFEAVLNRERWSVLADPTRVIEIDTTDFSSLEQQYAAILARIQDAQ